MARTSAPVWPASQTTFLDAVRVMLEIAFVIVSPIVTAVWVGAHERAQWDTDDGGDPDGESIVQVMQFISGVTALVIACILVAIVEVLRRRRKARRPSTTAP